MSISHSSENDDSDGIKIQALPVGNMADFDPSKIPSSAEEYLKRVVWESHQYEDVKTVELDSSKVKKGNPVVLKRKMQAPSGYAPSIETQKEFINKFSHLTSKIDRCRTTKNIPCAPSRLPRPDDEKKWCKFCLGLDLYDRIFPTNSPPKIVDIEPKVVEMEVDEDESGSESDETSPPVQDDENSSNSEQVPALIGQPPLLSILLNISTVGIENLVEWHGKWLEVVGFSEEHGRWLYSLIACLEKPLTPETCSALRHILKLCATIRASLETADHPHLVQINMIITIISKYFKQDDLADS